MEKINSDTDLRAAIAALEQKQLVEADLMKAQFHLAYESVKPINFIKSTIKEVTASQDIKDNLLNTGVGITAGYLSKKLFEGVSHSPLRKLLGTVLMFGITNAVAKNPEVIKAAATGVMKIINGSLQELKNSK